MAFAAADFRFFDVAVGLITEGTHLNAPLKCRIERTSHCAMQAQKLTGIGTRNRGHRTGSA